MKEDDITLEEEDLEMRIENIRRPRVKKQEPEVGQSKQKEINDLKRLLLASGEVIATLENKNNNLNNKAEFYEEVAEGLVTENKSLLRLQQMQEKKIQENNLISGKSVSFDLEPEHNASESVEEEDDREEEEFEEDEVQDLACELIQDLENKRED